MKNIFVTIFLIALSATIAKSQVEIQWQRCFGGTSVEKAYSIQQTTDRGYIVAGYTDSNNGDVSGNHGGLDIWVVKSNEQGNIQWQKCLGGTGAEAANSIQQTTDGGYIVAGRTGSNNGDVSGNNGGYDMWLIKLDPQGNIQWQNCLGGTSADYADAVQQTTDGGYIVAGYTTSNNGDVSGNHGGADMWIVKLDPQGNMQWQKCLGGTGAEAANSIQQTADGGYIVAGSAGSNTGDVLGNNGYIDMWVVKIDLQGNIQWQECLGGTIEEFVLSIQQTTDSGYIVAGYTRSNNGDVSGNHGNDDMWIVKLDSNRNIQWQKCLGGTNYDRAYSIQQTTDGGYIVAGHTTSNNGNVSGNHGGEDMWVIKLDLQGNIQWQKCLGGTIEDVSTFIKQTIDGGYIVAGYTYSNNGDVLGNNGVVDIWIVKLVEPNVSGIMFLDENLSGIKDSIEAIVAGHLVKLEPGPHYTYTNNNGYYYFWADTGNYNVSYVPQPYWYATTPVYNFCVDSLGHIIDTLDIGAYTRTNVNDVAVYITCAPTRINSQTHYWLTYKNWGSVNAAGTINFEYDPLLTFLSSTEIPASHTGNNLVFDYNTLGPGVQRTIRADFQMPGVQNLGDSLHSYAMITPLVPDTFVTNNYDTLQQVITGSYDPNDKSVSPAGYGQSGYVEHGQRLTYTIRFQNTGTDTAFTVLLRDTIDSDLDFGTFLLEANSHSVALSMHNSNELQFRFDNILLPDSNVNEPESHGFVRYSISPKPGLVDGTMATNTSYIFFDYNPAIVTNTTLNTFVTNIPVASPIREAKKTVVFPNPSNDVVYINLPELTRKVQVFNINGEMVKEIIPQRPVAEIPIQNLPKGVYAVRIYSSGNIISTKFVKE
jgi:uncharacterized repeat protein (TIGR01451 family)